MDRYLVRRLRVVVTVSRSHSLSEILEAYRALARFDVPRSIMTLDCGQRGGIQGTLDVACFAHAYGVRRETRQAPDA